MADRVGMVDGRHFTEWPDEVRRLKRVGEDDLALALLWRLVEATEADSRVNRWGVAPWCYEQIAIILRARDDRAGEVAVLERYAAQPTAPGASPPKLAERLVKARARLDQ